LVENGRRGGASGNFVSFVMMMNDNDYAGGKQYWKVECGVVTTLYVLPLGEPEGNGFESAEEVRQGFPEYVPSCKDSDT